MGIRYNPALDGLRAVAVLMVIAYHSGVWWVSQGYMGVDVFFVLSGFLITSILLAEEATGGIRLGAFYLRRARRLYPALCVLVAWMLWQGVLSARTAGVALLYLSDYVHVLPGKVGHLWSLAVEEHYYLLWPLLLPFVARMERRKALWLMGAVYVLALVWARVQPFGDGMFRFDTRLSGLVLGSLLAMLPRDSLLPFAGLLLSTVALAFGWHFQRIFVELATATVILLSYQTTLPWLGRQPLVWVGKISYGMYLFHMPLSLMFWNQFGPVLGLSILLAAASYYTVERAFRHKRETVGEPVPA